MVFNLAALRTYCKMLYKRVGMEGRLISSAVVVHHFKSFLDCRPSEVDFLKCHTQQPPCQFVPLPSPGAFWSLSWKVEGRPAPRGKTHEGAC